MSPQGVILSALGISTSFQLSSTPNLVPVQTITHTHTHTQLSDLGHHAVGSV